MKKILASDGVSHLFPGMLVLVRDTDKSEWQVSVFSHARTDSRDRYRYWTCSGTWWMCIPLRGNEELAGKVSGEINTCPDLEWGDKITVIYPATLEKRDAVFLHYQNAERSAVSVLVKGETQPIIFTKWERK